MISQNVAPELVGVKALPQWDNQLKTFCSPISLSTDAIIRIRPNQTKLEKKMDINTPSMAFEPPKRGDQKITCLFSGGQFKCPEGVVLSITILWAFLGVQSGLRQLQRRWIEVELPSEHSRLFRYMDARSWKEAFTQGSTMSEFSERTERGRSMCPPCG